jgi:hypothetical protein
MQLNRLVGGRLCGMVVGCVAGEGHMNAPFGQPRADLTSDPRDGMVPEPEWRVAPGSW